MLKQTSGFTLYPCSSADSWVIGERICAAKEVCHPAVTQEGKLFVVSGLTCYSLTFTKRHCMYNPGHIRCLAKIRQGRTANVYKSTGDSRGNLHSCCFLFFFFFLPFNHYWNWESNGKNRHCFTCSKPDQAENVTSESDARNGWFAADEALWRTGLYGAWGCVSAVSPCQEHYPLAPSSHFVALGGAHWCFGRCGTASVGGLRGHRSVWVGWNAPLTSCSSRGDSLQKQTSQTVIHQFSVFGREVGGVNLWWGLRSESLKWEDKNLCVVQRKNI